mgnify:CR=1 FL=1
MNEKGIKKAQNLVLSCKILSVLMWMKPISRKFYL